MTPEQTNECPQRENAQRKVVPDALNSRPNLRDRNSLRPPCRYKACFVSYAEPNTYNKTVTTEDLENGFKLSAKS